MPKTAIFEEAARTLDIPGGVKMIQEYYRQMRKFGCNILAVVQQYDIIKDSPVRGAMIGNSKMFTTVGFTTPGYRDRWDRDPIWTRVPETGRTQLHRRGTGMCGN